MASGGRPAPGYSRKTDGTVISDEQICEWIMEYIEGEESSYGYRKITVILNRDKHLVINKKKVYRLCKNMRVLKPQRQKRTKYPRRLARNRIITSSNQLWEVDIKYGFIAGEGRFFFVMPIIDVFDRSIVEFHIGLACEGRDVAQALKRALMRRQLYDNPVKPVIRSDNDPQFISKVFEETCEELKMEHERIPPRTPNLNAHVESFNRILEDDCIGKHEFETYQEAYTTVTEFIKFYNDRRIHSSIHYLAPTEFYIRNKSSQLSIKEVRV